MGSTRGRQLEWVYRNRQPRSRVEVIGALVPRLVGAGLAGSVRHRQEVRDCVGRVVDDTFREFCTLGKVDEQSVEIIVNQPTAVAALRRQWLLCLVEHLDRNCRFRVSPRIRFILGKEGDRLVGPGAGEAPLVRESEKH